LVLGQQILDLEPLREDIHRAMMRLYLKNGQRAQAARQFDICSMILARDLSIQPVEETQALYKQIITDADDSPQPKLTNSLTSYNQAVDQLRRATQTIELAQEQVQQALRFIKEYGTSNRSSFKAIPP
jgi:DNA-binding SARP family transcriptional activator